MINVLFLSELIIVSKIKNLFPMIMKLDILLRKIDQKNLSENIILILSGHSEMYIFVLMYCYTC